MPHQYKSRLGATVYGPQEAGKTQFSLAMTARISEGHVFYIDTKNDFSLSRLKSMMMNMKNIHQMLSNVSTAKTFDLHETIRITEILSKTTSYLGKYKITYPG